MSNSPLVTYTKISPNKNIGRVHSKHNPAGVIDIITPHHMAGNLTVETCGNVFASASRKASSNYGIGSDGRVAMYVEEKDRSWCSSSAANDYRAVTIEVANDGGAPDWHVSDKALASLIALCTDICKRNGIAKLNFTGNKDGNLTQHNYFANTSCPGPYLKSKFPYIEAEVNKQLAPASVPAPTPTPTAKVKKGDLVSINAGAKYYSGGNIPSWVMQDQWYVSSLPNGSDRAVLGENKSKKNNIQSPVNVSNLTVVSSTPAPAPTFKAYLVKVTTDALNYRSGPGTNYKVNGTIRDRGIYTIVEESNGWGKLKSGAGWISLNYTKKV